MKEAKKMQVTDQICKQVQLMRRGGANQTEIGMLLGVNPCTISRIESAGFSYEQYLENRRTRRKEDAARVAGKVGGEMVLFNPIVRQMKAI